MTDFKSESQLRKLGLLPHKKAYPSISIAGKEYSVRKLLKIDVENIALEYQVAAHWIAVVHYDMLRLKEQRDETARQLYTKEGRESLAIREESPVKLTESSIKVKLSQVSLLQEKKAELDRLDHQIAQRKVLLTAMENKRDMIVNLGAEMRKSNRGRT